MDEIRNKSIEVLSIKGYLPISEMEMTLNTDTDGSMFYRKVLDIQGNRIEYLLDFSNQSLLDFPNAYISESSLNILKEKFKHIQEPIPHLRKEQLHYNSESLYSICYQLHNSKIVPRGDILKVIDIIENYLLDYFNKIINKNSFINEYENDFGGIVISLVNLNTNPTTRYIIPYCNELFFLEDSKKITSKIIHIADKSKPDFSGLVEDDIITVKRFISFIQSWDKDAYGKFMDFLKTRDSSKNFNFLWRGFLLGGRFSWERICSQSLNSQENKRLLDEPVQFVHTQLLDFKKSVLRYLPAQSPQGLLNKKVLLVGLGAIGGYMADALTKIGAGIESDFVLVDKDQFLAENVSRHLLGLFYCGQFKASAIKQHLAENTFFQQKKIRCEIKNISSFDSKFFEKDNFDLIVDATGSLEVQEYLNETLQKLPKEKRPILQHLWIFGNGECVQGLWVDPAQQVKEGGCIQCLGSSADGFHQEYLPIKDISPEQRIGVCSAFTPYAVSGGMMATSLGINMILEWLSTGKIEKNYQTRYNSIHYLNKIEDINLIGNDTCRFCGESGELNEYK